MKLFKILAVFTLLFSSISPTTLVYAVSSLTPESSETANEETPTEPIAEPQVEEAPAVVDRKQSQQFPYQKRLCQVRRLIFPIFPNIAEI